MNTKDSLNTNDAEPENSGNGSNDSETNSSDTSKNATSSTQQSQLIQPQSLSVPKGGGAIQGLGEHFQLDEFTGTANLSVPIFSTPCRDFYPSMSIDYQSSAGNGAWGLGWQLSLGHISRKTNKGIPRYLGQDTFVMTGAGNLVPFTTNSQPRTVQAIDYNVTVYRSHIESSFALIEYWQPNAPEQQSRAFWRVIDANHIISIFGYSDHAKISDPDNPDHIFQWLLEEVYDAKGQHQLYTYKAENIDNVPDQIYEQHRQISANRYIHSIRYGNTTAVTDSMLLNGDIAVDEAKAWQFELIFDYGEYDLSTSNPCYYQPRHVMGKSTNWHYRPDPFSTYDAGFEIRTYRRCLNALMFHRFSELSDEPVLVHATQFDYQTNAANVSELAHVSRIGYQFDPSQSTYAIKAMPPVTLAYSQFKPSDHSFVPLTDKWQQPLVALDGDAQHQFLDLYGEGLPGILATEKAVVSYREPSLPPALAPLSVLSSDAINFSQNMAIYPATFDLTLAQLTTYDSWQPLAAFPNIMPEIGTTNIAMLLDMTGDGCLDVVVSQASAAGYWAQSGHSWGGFTSFKSFPTGYSVTMPLWLDMTGDGLADLVTAANNNVQVHPNLKSDGFGHVLCHEQAADMPPQWQSSAQQFIDFADMAGSGQTQLVAIGNGSVTYWPSLGYGRFAPGIEMGNAPHFVDDAGFDSTRIRLADLDGSGTSDLIYLKSDSIWIYFNRNGNEFTPEPLILILPARCDQLEQLSTTDIYGRGYNCIVFSASHADPHPQHWVYDCCQGNKPYLLTEIENNMGATTSITYTTSVAEYLTDKRAGLPWVSQLPFPIQVVKQITHHDQISGSRYVSLYAYHHGHYDGVEREFRGFGRVDRQDAEYFPPSKLAPDDPQYTAPALTRTWYHTGTYQQHQALLTQYQQEYYAGDKQALSLPESDFDWSKVSPNAASMRQAYTALAGEVLRSELYGLDDSTVPFSVTEHNYRITLRQQAEQHHYAVFTLHNQENLTYNYERRRDDPQLHHDAVLQVDNYGNVELSCAVAYGRRSEIKAALPEQQTVQLVCQTQQYINHGDVTQPQDYLLGVVIESASYHLTSPLASVGQLFSFNELAKLVSQALTTVSPSQPSSEEAKLLSWQRQYYAKTARVLPSSKQVRQVVNDSDPTLPLRPATVLPLGQVALPLLIAQQHVAEGAQADFTKAFKPVLTPQVVTEKLEQGYYHYDSTSQYWWNPGNTAVYLPAEQFYLLAKTQDAAGNVTTYGYDSPYYLLLAEVQDALDNLSQITQIDYRRLQPQQLRDINGNYSEMSYDALGMLVYTTHYGHEDGFAKGFGHITDAPKPVIINRQLIIEHPERYLGSMANFFYYDLFAWLERREPVFSMHLAATDYPLVNTKTTAVLSLTLPIQIALVYTDGFSRVVQAKQKVEAGQAFLYDPATHRVSQGTTTHRWLTSGQTVYNNKGLVIKQYEPYYIDTPDYLCDSVLAHTELAEFGATPLFYYDPLDRLIKTITPKGFLVTQAWDAWETTTQDANDTLKHSPYYQANITKPDKESPYYDANLSDDEKVILQRTVINCDQTPNKTIIDNLGHPILQQVIKRYCPITNTSPPVCEQKTLTTYATYDVVGQLLRTSDPRLAQKGIPNTTLTYSLGGQTLVSSSVDAGTHWQLLNVMGNLVYACDKRGIVTMPHYDALHRPSVIHVQKPVTATDPDKLDHVVERFIYGDTSGAVDDPDQQNLRGQLYQYYDSAGLVTVTGYSLSGQPLTASRRFTTDYKNTPDWGDSSKQARVSLLQAHTYEQCFTYDALGRLKQTTDVDGNTQQHYYHLSGLLQRVRVTTADDGQATNTIHNITYNAKGQRQQMQLGNGMITEYDYDPKTWFVTRIKTQNAKKGLLQDLSYLYDPVGNVGKKINRQQLNVIYANEIVSPDATYDYNSLYQLKRATGREKIGVTSAQNKRNNKPAIQTTPGVNDNQALQNYIECYDYDPGGNLTTILHQNKQGNNKSEIIVADDSNRAVSATIRGKDQPPPTPDQVDDYFDANGNQIQTQQIHPLRWDYRNNLQKAVTVKRADGCSDTEYYVYDGSGQRVRKVTEQYQNQNMVMTIKETLYLDDLEIRRSLQGADLADAKITTEYHSLRILDIATRDYWCTGKPPKGFTNPVTIYHLSDRLGSATTSVDQNGAIISQEEYSPYGNSVLFFGSGSQLKHYRYAGKERDSTTGFYYYGARYYAPWLGRWLSADPAGAVDGLNLYAFVTGNPVTHTDIGGMGSSSDEEEKTPRRSARIANQKKARPKPKPKKKKARPKPKRRYAKKRRRGQTNTTSKKSTQQSKKSGKDIYKRTGFLEKNKDDKSRLKEFKKKAPEDIKKTIIETSSGGLDYAATGQDRTHRDSRNDMVNFTKKHRDDLDLMREFFLNFVPSDEKDKKVVKVKEILDNASASSPLTDDQVNTLIKNANSFRQNVSSGDSKTNRKIQGHLDLGFQITGNRNPEASLTPISRKIVSFLEDAEEIREEVTPPLPGPGGKGLYTSQHSAAAANDFVVGDSNVRLSEMSYDLLSSVFEDLNLEGN